MQADASDNTEPIINKRPLVEEQKNHDPQNKIEKRNVNPGGQTGLHDAEVTQPSRMSSLQPNETQSIPHKMHNTETLPSPYNVSTTSLVKSAERTMPQYTPDEIEKMFRQRPMMTGSNPTNDSYPRIRDKQPSPILNRHTESASKSANQLPHNQHSSLSSNSFDIQIHTKSDSLQPVIQGHVRNENVVSKQNIDIHMPSQSTPQPSVEFSARATKDSRIVGNHQNSISSANKHGIQTSIGPDDSGYGFKNGEAGSGHGIGNGIGDGVGEGDPDDEADENWNPEQDGCPFSMVMIPAGKVFCIDQYEFPNNRGGRPMIGVTLMQAKSSCEEQNKRLCTSNELSTACRGTKRQSYPYGDDFISSKCGNGGASGPSPSGRSTGCVSDYHVYDIVGNTWEWTDSGTLFGGAYNSGRNALSCATSASPGRDQSMDNVGFRCCK